MKSHYLEAIHYFNNNYNCAQSVFAAYKDQTNINETDSLKIATAFGGGMADLQKTCGAVTGALMVLGATLYNIHNQSITEDIVNQYSNTLINLIENKYGSSDCAKLTNIDFSSQNPLDKTLKKQMHETCYQIIEDVCIILDEMIKSKNAGQK